MAEEKSFPMTAEGKEKLAQELEDLRLKRRPEVIKRIKIARSYGDLSENSEYESAKDEQAFVEGRIAQIQNMLQYAVIIDNESVDKNEVSMGRKVTFQELPDEDPESYQIVGESESDPLSGKISNESPMAKGLLGHKVGEEVEIAIPNGTMKVKILKVEDVD
ncbi:transcription elongation factor GreA [Limosilactobacillus difficilis]|uniref:transcription elongation factor GreA n=1 Tax=Limosilactobacillus difficilis TaxID=2991838 RepID=UPI0024BA57E4|nr:transcription elongation factor GreA [Limosilactobacillus difficilis]